MIVELISAPIRELEERVALNERDIKLLQGAEVQRVTATGVWTIVKGKLDEEAIDWVKWGIRGAAAAIAGSLLPGLGYLITKVLQV